MVAPLLAPLLSVTRTVPTTAAPPAPVASTILSRTVAGGAAVVGTVLVTDSKGASKGATIEANGHYSIDVSGMTGPFVLKAAGTVGNTTVTYYSAATTADPVSYTHLR